MPQPLTYQDDLRVFKVSEVADLNAVTTGEITGGHEFGELMADGVAVGADNSVVAEEMLGSGTDAAARGKTSSDIGSQAMQPEMTFRRMDASDADFDALTRGERFVLVLLPTGKIEDGEPYDAFEVRSSGPSPEDSEANAYQKYSVSLPARDWVIGGTVGGGS